MSFFLTYPTYDSLGQIRFLSPDLIVKVFEIANQEDPVMGTPAQSKEIVSASFVNLSHLEIHLSMDFFLFPFQPFFSEPKISILRC
jgi:hypothetical protein